MLLDRSHPWNEGLLPLSERSSFRSSYLIMERVDPPTKEVCSPVPGKSRSWRLPQILRWQLPHHIFWDWWNPVFRMNLHRELRVVDLHLNLQGSNRSLSCLHEQFQGPNYLCPKFSQFPDCFDRFSFEPDLSERDMTLLGSKVQSDMPVKAYLGRALSSLTMWVMRDERKMNDPSAPSCNTERMCFIVLTFLWETSKVSGI